MAIPTDGQDPHVDERDHLNAKDYDLFLKDREDQVRDVSDCLEAYTADDMTDEEEAMWGPV